MGIIDACLNGKGTYSGKAYFFKAVRSHFQLKHKEIALLISRRKQHDRKFNFDRGKRYE
jgi:hypothetical protein